MISSLYSGVSGMQQFQGQLDVIGNNIANSNTLGYKSARADFEDTFSQTLRAPGSGAPGIQVGSGVGTSSVQTSFSQGTLNQTSYSTDMAVSGNGFFVARDATSGTELYTRSGNFHVDSAGFLATNGGLRVQGFNDSTLSTRGDIKVNNSDFKVSDNGVITDASGSVLGQFLLQTFSSPQALHKEGGNFYSAPLDAGALGGGGAAGAQAARTNGLGRIQQNSLESSNVDLTGEFANLITSQRGFQANAKVITTSDEMLQEVIGLKR